MWMEDDSFTDLRNSLANEAVYISKLNYSVLRSNPSKWQTLPPEPNRSLRSPNLTRKRSDRQLTDPTERQPSSNSTSSLKTRLDLKRNLDFFTSAYLLWLTLNPFHLKGISSSLWLKFNEFLYSVFIPYPDPKIALSFAAQDTKADLHDDTALYFADFYNSLFEFVDCSCKSKLASEYIRLVNRIKLELLSSRILDSVSLHSKHHLKDTSQGKLPAWMASYVKEVKRPRGSEKQIKQSFTFPSTSKRPMTTLTKRFQMRISTPKVKRIHSGRLITNLRLDRLDTESSNIRASLSRTLAFSSPTSAKTVNSLKSARQRARFPEHLDIISPLSTNRLESRKQSRLLEGVIQVRKHFALSQVHPGSDSEIYNSSPKPFAAVRLKRQAMRLQELS